MARAELSCGSHRGKRSNEPKEKRNARTHGKRRSGADLDAGTAVERVCGRIQLFSGRTRRGDKAAWNNRADACCRDHKTHLGDPAVAPLQSGHDQYRLSPGGGEPAAAAVEGTGANQRRMQSRKSWLLPGPLIRRPSRKWRKSSADFISTKPPSKP